MIDEEIVKSALKLTSKDRVDVATSMLFSLDQPNPTLNAIWVEEAARRLAAYRKGRVSGVQAEDIFGDL